MSVLSQSDRARLARLRRLAKAQGLAIRKSRRRDDDGGLMLVDVACNALVAGSRFDLGLDDVAEHLAA